MRRIRVILALLTLVSVCTLFGPGVGPADAHFCSIPATVKVGEEIMVNIGVAAEEKPVGPVDIQIPDGWDLKEPVGYLGYTATVEGTSVHFEGGTIDPYTCHYFGFEGKATKRGRLIAQIVTTATDGTKTRYFDPRPISQFPAEVIYAGVSAADFAPKVPKAGGVSPVVALAIAVAAGLVVVGGAVLINRRRGA